MTPRRFFRRYFLTGIGLILLFLVANLTMMLGLGALLDEISPFRVPMEELAALVQTRDGRCQVQQQEMEAMLAQNDLPWAMVLAPDGVIAWSHALPAAADHPYTAADIARMSRWYLEDYPVVVRTLADGSLLVVACNKDRVLRVGLSTMMTYRELWATLYGCLAIFGANLLLVVALFWRSLRRMEKSAAPLLQGVGRLAAGRPTDLPETGELGPVQAALNRVSAQMARRDAARAEWINGISHDVRTPLAVMLGYAGTLEADPALPAAAREQAGMIRAQGERLRRLISDLNLASQLEYSMQPLQWRHLDPAELAREVLSDLLNAGLPEQYSLELQLTGREDTMEGDPALLARALENLVRNSIAHNPGGCTVRVTVDRRPEACVFTVQDDGVGIGPAVLEQINAGRFDGLRRGGQGGHGFGLRLVAGIARAHGGRMVCRPAQPTGLEVELDLPAARPAEET